VRELESFGSGYTRTGVRYSAPEGLDDDCVCALALAVMALERRWVPLVGPACGRLDGGERNRYRARARLRASVSAVRQTTNRRRRS
jgi:hypothetical protein